MHALAMPSFGRPSRGETRRRTRELLAELAAGQPLREASRRAGVKPERVLRMFDDDVFFATYCALRARSEEAAA